MYKSSEYQSTWHKRFWTLFGQVVATPVILSLVIFCVLFVLLKYLPNAILAGVFFGMPWALLWYVKRILNFKIDIDGFMVLYFIYCMIATAVVGISIAVLSDPDSCRLKDNYTLSSSSPDLEDICVGHLIFRTWNTYVSPYSGWLSDHFTPINTLLTFIVLVIQVSKYIRTYIGWFIHDKEKK